jgi:ferrous iron transport protein A
MYYNLFITEVNMSKSKKTIRDLLPGQSGVVTELASVGALRRRIIDMGITPGAVVTLKKVAPMGDPIEINVRGYELSIRKEDAKSIIIEDCEDK